MLMTGKQVKEMATREGWLLVKFLPFENLDGRGRNNFEYKYGLNVPLEPVDFSVENSCSPGGLYFTFMKDEMKKQLWVRSYAYHVTISDDASVMYYEEEVKFKTDQLIIEKPCDQEFYDKYWYFNLKWSKIQTPEICLKAVRQDGFNLQFVKEKTPEICLAAVQQYGLALGYVQKQTPGLCLAAVQTEGMVLIFVEEQTPEICLAAVQQNGRTLKYVKEQTPEICLAAVQQDGWALEFVKEQTPEICLAAVTRQLQVAEL